MMHCQRCDDPLPTGQNRCKCGAWTWERHVDISRDLKYWEDIDEQPLKRMKLGLMDECLCGGVVLSDVVLIAGGPGAGKTTLLLQACESIWQHGTCLWIAAEEDTGTIKGRGHTRMKLRPPPKKMIFINGMGGGIDIGQALIDIKPAGFIVDSVTSLANKNPVLEVELLGIIKKFCVQLQAPAIVVSQVNADEEFSGHMAKRHDADVLLRLSRDDETSDNGEPIRILESVDKNRNGRTGIETRLEMTDQGLVKLAGSGV